MKDNFETIRDRIRMGDLASLPLEQRYQNRLHQAGIFTIQELLDYIQADEGKKALCKIKGIGIVGAEQICCAIRQFVEPQKYLVQKEDHQRAEKTTDPSISSEYEREELIQSIIKKIQQLNQKELELLLRNMDALF